MEVNNPNKEKQKEISKKTKFLGLFLLLLLLIGIIGGIALNTKQSKETKEESKQTQIVEKTLPTPSTEAIAKIKSTPTNTPNPTEISNPTNTPSSTPIPLIGYATYKDNKTKLSFEYRKDMVVKVVRTEASDDYIYLREYTITKGKSSLKLTYTSGIGCTQATTPQNQSSDKVIKLKSGGFAGRTKANGKYLYGTYTSSKPGQGYFSVCGGSRMLNIRGIAVETELTLANTNDLQFFDGLIASLNQI